MKTYGLIGKSLGHSFSKQFFTDKFSAEKTDAEYLNFEIENIDEVKELLTSGVSGFNITIPYKEAIIPYLDELDEVAEKIGAVNTIVYRDGKTIGYNTDAFGFAQSIKPFLTFQHERALILGTGGASKAVAYVLKNLGIDVLYISTSKQGEKIFSYEDVNEHMLKACMLVVNTTPVGTFPNVDQCIPFPYEFFTHEHLAVDLIYNPEKTQFLRKAQEHGSPILNGRNMLIQQAMKSYELWV
jgi:shikimate dehydrogenase